MERLLKFCSLSPRHKQLFCEAAILLLFSRISIRMIAFRHIEKFLRTRWSGRAPDGLDLAENIKLVRLSVSRAAHLFQSKNPCLSRSIAEFVMFRRRGIPAVMHLGARFSDNSFLLAHAWVHTTPEELDKSSENSAYAPLLIIGQELASIDCARKRFG
jgi:hypothetical protein